MILKKNNILFYGNNKNLIINLQILYIIRIIIKMIHYLLKKREYFWKIKMVHLNYK